MEIEERSDSIRLCIFETIVPTAIIYSVTIFYLRFGLTLELFCTFRVEIQIIVNTIL